MHLSACQYSKRYVRMDNGLYNRVHPLARARVRARIGSRELDGLFFQAREASDGRLCSRSPQRCGILRSRVCESDSWPRWGSGR